MRDTLVPMSHTMSHTGSFASTIFGEPEGLRISAAFGEQVLPRLNIEMLSTQAGISTATATDNNTSTTTAQDDGALHQFAPPRALTAEERFAFWQDMYGKTVTVQTPHGPRDMVVEPIFTPENMGPTHAGQDFTFQSWMSWLYRPENNPESRPELQMRSPAPAFTPAF